MEFRWIRKGFALVLQASTTVSCSFGIRPCGQFFLMQQSLSVTCSPISWSQELSVQLNPSRFLTTFCQKADVVGYFISVEVWWTGWALLNFCCYRREFLRAWTKDILFLLMNKLPAAKQNITELNRTECVLHFKRLFLFWQESKANVNAEDKSERTKSCLSRLVRNQVSLMGHFYMRDLPFILGSWGGDIALWISWQVNSFA